jgi:hypothetical protein
VLLCGASVPQPLCTYSRTPHPSYCFLLY